MKITPLAYSNRTLTQNQKMSNPFLPTFGEYETFEIIKSNKNLIMEELHNFSGVFRDDAFWDDFSDYLVQNHANGIKVHSATGSNASEAYTIIMELFDKYPQVAQNYLPIKVTDISPAPINSIKSGKIYLSDREKLRMEYCLTSKKMEDFFELLPDDNVENEKHLFKGHNYAIKENLSSNIEASVEDVFKYVKNAENFKEPVVMLLRNCWYQFTPEAQKELVEESYKQLKPTSSVVIGSIDMIKLPKLLMEQGFNRVNRFVFERPFLNIRG